MPNCLPTTYPMVSESLSPNFGIPKGVPGRNGRLIQGIVIHCVGTDAATYIAKACQPFKRTYAAGGTPPHASLHYLVSDTDLTRIVEEENIAWGFGTQDANGMYCPPQCATNWLLINQNPNINPDEYTLHIGLTGGIGPGCECNCQCSKPSHLAKAGNALLVRLVRALADKYAIPVDANHIAFHQDLSECAEECPCDSIDGLLCAVTSYCEQCEPIVTRHASQHCKDGCDPIDIACIADACDLGRIITGTNSGAVPTKVLVKDPTGCIVESDAAAIVQAYETPWTVADNTFPGLIVTPGGTNGHAVTFGFDPCVFGAAVDLGVIAANGVLGVNVDGCLIRGGIDQFLPPETPFAGQDSDSIAWTAGGPYGHTPSASVKVCSALGGVPNALAVNAACGLYVPQGANVQVMGPITGTGTQLDPLRLDLCAFNLNTGVIERVVGEDGSDCLVSEVAQQFVVRNETPWTGQGFNGVVITTGGANGHDPDISIDFCRFGAAIPPAALVAFVGVDATGCLAKASIAGTICQVLGGMTPNGVASFGSTLLVGADCRVYEVTETPFAPQASPTVQWTPSGPYGHQPRADVLISDDPGQLIQIRPDGIYVPTLPDSDAQQLVLNGTNLGITNGNTINLCAFLGAIPAGAAVGAGQTINLIADDCTKRAVSIPAPFDMCAAIAARPAGAAISAGQSIEVLATDCTRRTINVPADVPFVANDSATIDFSVSGTLGHTLTGSVKLSATAGNAVVLNANGIYVPDFCTALAARPAGAVVAPGAAINLLASDCTVRSITQPGNNTIAVSPDNGGGTLALAGAGGAATGNIQQGVLIDTGNAAACTLPAAVRGADGMAYDINAFTDATILVTDPGSPAPLGNVIGPFAAGTDIITQTGSLVISNPHPCKVMRGTIDVGLLSAVFQLTPPTATTSGLIGTELSFDGGATWLPTFRHSIQNNGNVAIAHRINYYPDNLKFAIPAAGSITVQWRERMQTFAGNNVYQYIYYKPGFRIFGTTN